MHANNSIELLGKVEYVQAIKDFFLAKNIDEIQKSLEKLLFYSQNNIEDKDDKQRLLKLEKAYNKLFVKPRLAPPFASAYLEKKLENIANSPVDIDKFIDELGLDFTSDSDLQNDHISIELEIWLVLSNVIEKLNGKMLGLASNSDEFANAKELLLDMVEKMQWLENEHMLIWIKQFIKRIYNAYTENENPEIDSDKEDLLIDEIVYVVACLEAWLEKYTEEKQIS